MLTSVLQAVSTEVILGPNGIASGDSIKVVFTMPPNFQQLAPPGLPSQFQMTTDYLQFFNNAQIKFKLKAHCEKVSEDGIATIKEQLFYITDTNCVHCKLPLSQVGDFTNINCPGCILPGWNLGKTQIERINYGYEDLNDNHYPDSFPQNMADGSNARSERAVIGDTLRITFAGSISDGNPNKGLTFANIGFAFTEGQLVFQSPALHKMEYLGGSGYFEINGIQDSFYVPVSEANYYFGNSTMTIPMDTAALARFGVSGLQAYDASNRIQFSPNFRISGNFDDGTGANSYIDVKEFNTFFYIGGQPFSVPNSIPDANIVQIDTFISYTPMQRKNHSYWCTATEGRFIGVGVDFLEALVMAGSADCGLILYNTIRAYSGSETTPPTTSYDPRPGAYDIFDFELRDFWNIDSITYFFPDGFYSDSVQFSSSSPFTNINGEGQMSYIGYGRANYDENVATSTDTSITLFPELFNANTTNFTIGDNFNTFDENLKMSLHVLVKPKECMDDDLTPITYPYVHTYFSNFPGATNGDTLIVTQVNVSHPTAAPGLDGNIDNPNPKILFDALTSVPQSGYNLGWDMNLSVELIDTTLNYLTIIPDNNNNIAYNTFVAFHSPSGNISGFQVSDLTTTTFNQILNVSSTVSSPVTIVDSIDGRAIFAMNTIGGYPSIFKDFTLSANYDCSGIPPGGIDSIYVIKGWNCFDYPGSFEEACFVDTAVIYIPLPPTGLDITFEAPDTVSLCDTINFSVVFDPTGEGQVENILVEIRKDSNSTLDYLAQTGILAYDGIATPVEPQISDSICTWLLDSLSSSLLEFNGTSPTATLSFSLATGCDLDHDSVSILMSGTNFCGQVIQELEYVWKAATIVDSPVLDSFDLEIAVDSIYACNDSSLVTITLSNKGTKPSGAYNTLAITLPSDFPYSSGAAFSTSDSDTVIFNLNDQIPINGQQQISFYIRNDSFIGCGKYPIVGKVLLAESYACDSISCIYYESPDSAISASANLAILDSLPPLIACPQNIVLASGDSVATWNLTASDDCLLDTLFSNIVSGTVFQVGTTPVIVTALDACGNSASCTFDVVRVPPLVVDAGECQSVYPAYQPMACTDLTANLVVGSTGPYSYLWSNGDTSQTTTVCPIQSTTYTVTVIDDNGFPSSSSVLVNVIDVSCGNKGKKISVCHLPPGNPGNAHQICIAQQAVGAHVDPTYGHSGCYIGPCNQTDPCDSNSGKRSGSSLDPTELTSLHIYPNPNKGTFRIELPPDISVEDTKVEIYDLLGNQIHQISPETVKFDVTISLSESIYFVKVSCGNLIEVRKVMIYR